ncbi:MAG: bifunctional demethylmenaquinone methyltransferase/2-methoxy-6-polyprenyl-1,4-benzoquinol methylase UbiE [Planctomycetota bacterium]
MNSPANIDAAPSGGVDKSGERVSEMFRQIAPRYDTMNHVLSGGVDFYWRWRAVRRMRPAGEGSPMLDVCTGTGDLALAMAQKFTDREVVGTDFCAAMLDLARDKRMKDDATKGIDFIEADSQQLPFDDNRFGAVTVAFGLRNVADTDRGLAEMMRVCVPGGQVMVLEFAQPTMPIVKQVYGFYFRNILPRIGQWFARNEKEAYDYLPESVGEFPFGQALADRMVGVGLTNVRFTPMTLGTVMIYEGTKPLHYDEGSMGENP